jgi:hypothetical protein
MCPAASRTSDSNVNSVVPLPARIRRLQEGAQDSRFGVASGVLEKPVLSQRQWRCPESAPFPRLIFPR